MPAYMITVTLIDYDTGPAVEIEAAQELVRLEFENEYPGAVVDVIIEELSARAAGCAEEVTPQA